MSFLAGLLLCLMVLFIVRQRMKEGRENIIKSLGSSQNHQSHNLLRFNKILSWCEKKYKKNASFFVEKHSNPEAVCLLITILSNLGAILYLRTCGIRFKNESIKFSSKNPINILEVITKDQFLLFMLGEDVKLAEVFPSGKHIEKAVAYYQSDIEEHGLEEAWKKLKIDIYTFLNNRLTERAKSWASL